MILWAKGLVVTGMRQVYLHGGAPSRAFGSLSSHAEARSNSCFRQLYINRTPLLHVAGPHRTLFVTSAAADSASPSNQPNNCNNATQSKPNLRAIKGVGRVNERKLLEKGLDSLESLTRMYIHECGSDPDAAIKFLRETVGIRHRTHCADIVSHLIEVASEPAARKLTLCVEGNISAGKSTFLNFITEGSEEFKQQLQVVPEPVQKWQNVSIGSDRKFNLLDEFYKSPAEMAYMFQSYVFITRVMQERESYGGSTNPYRLMERSVFSDRMVFVRALHDDRLLNDMQLAVYDNWFLPMVAELPSLVPDGFVYLRASPNTCMRRMKMRSRSEEAAVDQGYLEGLHWKHEDWLHVSADGHIKGGDSSTFKPLAPPSIIASELQWTRPDNVPLVRDVLKQVPVLVLDCDSDMDIDRDISAKRLMADKVLAFFNYARSHQQHYPRPSPSDVGGASINISRHLAAQKLGGLEMLQSTLMADPRHKGGVGLMRGAMGLSESEVAEIVAGAIQRKLSDVGPEIYQGLSREIMDTIKKLEGSRQLARL